ncbi:MAG: hypothetical protein WBD22_04620, partial [Pyrinomonadaceae bacterium]
DNWGSLDTNIAGVDNGLATGIGFGSTNIFADWVRIIYVEPNCGMIPQPIYAESPIEVEPACAYPVSFQQDGAGTDAGSGTLRFRYTWASSTGNMSDLGACSVGEIVTYPGTGNYTPPSPPFNQTFLNPTIIDLPATDGAFIDNHNTSGGFVTPYSEASFTATQFYRYKCPCRNNGNYVNLTNSIDIVRAVTRIGQTQSYKFTITKSGSSATINPLP